MEAKDWLLLLVPVLCNGLVVFGLQKIFERKQAKNLILHEYYSELRKKIDIALGIHAKAVRLANEGDIDDIAINVIIESYFDSCLDVYYYYIQNTIVFSDLKKDCETLASILMELSTGVNNHTFTALEISNKINIIRDILQNIKKLSIR